MEFYLEGNKNGPILVCIHALMGGPEDYMSYRQKWAEHCQLVLMDMDVEARKLGWADQKAAASVLNYSDKSKLIAEYIKETFPGRRAYFVGISLGGKILYEIAAKYPEIFGGGVVTDTGPGSLMDSEFSSEASEGVYTLNLRQPWRDLKKDLDKKFSDRKTRILISTQIEYKNPEGPGRWKPGLAIIYDLICGSKMENQWDLVEQMNPDYQILVLKSLQRSGIGHRDFKRMKQYPVFDILEVPESNHFFHISSHGYVSQAALYMVGKGERPKLAKRHTSFQLPKVWDTLLQGYRIRKQMEKQMITQLTAENLETLHPAIIPNLLRKLDAKMIHKLDRKVFQKLDPEVLKNIPQTALAEVKKVLEEKLEDRSMQTSIFGPIPRFATALAFVLFLLSFLLAYTARSEDVQTVPSVPSTELGTTPPAPSPNKVWTAEELEKMSKGKGVNDLDAQGKKIAKDIEKFHLGFGGENAEIEMILVSSDGQQVTRKMQSKTLEGKEMSFRSAITFQWPPDIKGTKVLLWNNPEGENSQWVFLPTVKRVKRISARNVATSFMGSEFTYEDLGGREHQKFDYKLIQENAKDEAGKDAWVMEIFPRGGDSGYSKIRAWIRKDIYSPSKIEYFDRAGKSLKIATFKNYQQFKSRWWRVGEIELANVQTQRKTIMRWNKRELGLKLRSDEFSPEKLQF